MIPHSLIAMPISTLRARLNWTDEEFPPGQWLRADPIGRDYSLSPGAYVPDKAQWLALRRRLRDVLPDDAIMRDEDGGVATVGRDARGVPELRFPDGSVWTRLNDAFRVEQFFHKYGHFTVETGDQHERGTATGGSH